jgi:hypothetical protein
MFLKKLYVVYSPAQLILRFLQSRNQKIIFIDKIK